MIKFILDDYRYQIRTALKENLLKVLGIFSCGYLEMMIILELNYITYSVGMIPILLGMLLSEMYPNQMRKIMFLCPFTGQERKKYLTTAYRIRICIPMAVGWLLSVPAFLAGQIRLLCLLGIHLLVFMFLIGVNLKHVPVDQENLCIPKQNHRLEITYAWFRAFLLLIAMITMIVFSINWGGMKEMTRIMIAAVLLITEMILCKRMHSLYYEFVMMLGTHYELCHPRSQSRQEQNGKG